MKKTLLATLIIALAAVAGLFIFVKFTSAGDKELNFAEVKTGYFEITVSASGELIAENSIDIKGPNIVGNRHIHAVPLKITDLVSEGTTVKAGDYIATLDRSSFNNSLKDEQEQLDSDVTTLQMKVLDTAVVMSGLRDEIRNQSFIVEEARITLDQSKFEPPATQRQAEIDLDKAQRTLAQKQKIYALKKAQTNAEIRTLMLKASTQQRKVNDLDSVLKSFIIKAPADGMVIYKKDRMGKKIAVGTTLNPWEPVVATLPDLSSLLSKIYVSEIDISRIQKGQSVDMTIDAFPDRHFQGNVFSIANIGEQLANSDTKVFEVMVKISNPDPMLRPSMTTSNKVVIETFNNVVYVPNESVYAGIDSIPFVYTRDGLRQVVLLGKSNEKNIIIEEGLEPGTEVWLTVPENAEKFRLSGTGLIQKIKEREVAETEAI